MQKYKKLKEFEHTRASSLKNNDLVYDFSLLKNKNYANLAKFFRSSQRRNWPEKNTITVSSMSADFNSISNFDPILLHQTKLPPSLHLVSAESLSCSVERPCSLPAGHTAGNVNFA